ncbi:hypothetical protein AAG570_013398 [Ranatra chinensis]|uniref:GTP-binding protein Di-Ras2 n=1 Tax=Ranatra chinensis TaxID=642074 RepID=A0ABD0Z0A3_9HEMI
MCDHDRIRLVMLGGAGVGKSAILKRFLFGTFTDKYKSTVEDLYSRDYDLGSVSIKVDILDTCGDLQFPAMRRLSIATANAFLLVYACNSADSFSRLKCCFEEIREQRDDFQQVPIVVAGNKLDMAPSHREVPLEDVSEWLYCELPRLRTKLVECSAKDNYNIRDMFKCFLTLYRILPPSGNETSLKRSASRQGGSRRAGSPATLAATSAEDGAEPGANSKPRSRSLIRRSSRKAKQQPPPPAPGAADECHLS